DPAIVDRCYGPLAMETLNVRPGLASPGSIYHFTHGEDQLDTAEVEIAYINRLLPRKLALDLEYVREASLPYDVKIAVRAASVILERGCGRRVFSDPPEMSRTRQLENEIYEQIKHLLVGGEAQLPAQSHAPRPEFAKSPSFLWR